LFFFINRKKCLFLTVSIFLTGEALLAPLTLKDPGLLYIEKSPQ